MGLLGSRGLSRDYTGIPLETPRYWIGLIVACMDEGPISSDMNFQSSSSLD